MARPLAPMPRSPLKRYRDISEHGHHRLCACHDDSERDQDITLRCSCWELDEEDWQCACEERYDAWKNGDYEDL